MTKNIPSADNPLIDAITILTVQGLDPGPEGARDATKSLSETRIGVALFKDTRGVKFEYEPVSNKPRYINDLWLAGYRRHEIAYRYIDFLLAAHEIRHHQQYIHHPALQEAMNAGSIGKRYVLRAFTEADARAIEIAVLFEKLKSENIPPNEAKNFIAETVEFETSSQSGLRFLGERPDKILSAACDKYYKEYWKQASSASAQNGQAADQILAQAANFVFCTWLTQNGYIELERYRHNWVNMIEFDSFNRFLDGRLSYVLASFMAASRNKTKHVSEIKDLDIVMPTAEEKQEIKNLAKQLGVLPGTDINYLFGEHVPDFDIDCYVEKILYPQVQEHLAMLSAQLDARSAVATDTIFPIQTGIMRMKHLAFQRIADIAPLISNTPYL